MDLNRHALQLRPRLLAAGHTDAELLRLRRSGILHTIRGGAYVPCDDQRLRTPEDRHLLLVESTLPRLGPGAVVSHVSAALLHGLPVWNIPLQRVHATRDARSGGRVSGRLHLHVSPLEADDVVDIGGVAVTSVARTVLDLTLSVSFESAVVVADAALANPLVGPALLEVMQRSARRPGAPRARRVLGFADGRSGSAGESRSRVALMHAGLPVPVLQWEVRAAGGGWIGNVDFGWPALNTVGEFDGEVKYGRLLRPGQDPGDVVFAEKVREDALRDTTLGVVRWIWSELDDFAPVAARLRRNFARAAGRSRA